MSLFTNTAFGGQPLPFRQPMQRRVVCLISMVVLIFQIMNVMLDTLFDALRINTLNVEPNKFDNG